MATPWPRDYTPSDWNDPLDAVATSLMPSYNSGQPRSDLVAVQRLATIVAPQRLARHVAVVGTNGKSSTSHFLARLLREHGLHVGLYTSPHIRYWNERIQIDLAPVPAADWTRAVLAVHEQAQRRHESAGDLRFFDVLTLAAERLFVAARVDVGIFEAGIGGRLDAVRVLQPGLTLLTSIGRDHEDILGDDPLDRLDEKSAIAPAGGSLVASALAADLADHLVATARRRSLALTLLPAIDDPSTDDGVPAYQRANARLAEAGSWLLGERRGGIEDHRLSGRFEHGAVAGVRYIADVAHNPTAWAAFLAAVPERPYEIVAAITRPRPIGDFVEVLAAHRGRIGHLTATSIRVRPAQSPAEMARLAQAAGIPAQVVLDPREAFASAVRRARDSGRTLLVFGSTYLVVDFSAWATDAQQPAPGPAR